MSFLNELQHLRMPLTDIELATNNFATSIGKGGFGEVYKGELLLSGGLATVAVKRLNSRVSGQGAKEFLTEINLLSSYKHQNLISLLGFCEEGTEKILVYEYAKHGSLGKYLNGANTTRELSWMKRLEICVGVARGLDYLHNRVGKHHRIIHRDIKSANILLDHKWEAKISDLGLSRLGLANESNSFIISNVCGTIGYCDPVYHATGILTKESDVYSFGVVLFEVLCGRPCFINSKDERRCLVPLAKRYYEKRKIEEIIDPNLRDQINVNSLSKFLMIAYQCLQENREQRPLISLVLEELEKALEFQRKWIKSLQKSYEEGPIHKSYDKRPLIANDSIDKIFHHIGRSGSSRNNAHYDAAEAAPKDLKTPMALQLKEIKEITKNFGSNSLIAEGTHARVYFGVLRTGQAAAIRKLFSKQPQQEFLAQVAQLSRLKHDNIVKLLGYCVDGDLRVLVYEYASKGSLQDILHGQRVVKWIQPGPVLSWPQRVKIALGAAKGLEYLHAAQPRNLHRNIKSSNILVFHNDTAKIADADLSIQVSEMTEHLMTERFFAFGCHPPEYDWSYEFKK